MTHMVMKKNCGKGHSKPWFQGHKDLDFLVLSEGVGILKESH